MPDTDLRYFYPIERISQTGQQLIKVNNYFGSCFPNPVFDETHTFQIRRDFQQIVANAPQDIIPLVGSRRQKIGTLKPLYRRLDGSGKECRQLP